MKRQRQNKILEIINNNVIDTQDALIEKLREEGYDVTQATASRDIRELNLTKVALGGGVYKYAESHKDDVKISVKYKNYNILLISLIVAKNIHQFPTCTFNIYF